MILTLFYLSLYFKPKPIVSLNKTSCISYTTCMTFIQTISRHFSDRHFLLTCLVDFIAILWASVAEWLKAHANRSQCLSPPRFIIPLKRILVWKSLSIHLPKVACFQASGCSVVVNQCWQFRCTYTQHDTYPKIHCILLVKLPQI